jgi:hypothetical protein
VGRIPDITDLGLASSLISEKPKCIGLRLAGDQNS